MRCFSLSEIKLATHDFDDTMVIGKGGYGKVYKGLIDNGSHTVAIKQLNLMSKQGDPEFRTEIEMFSMFRHSNIVSLIGYCDDNNEKILVYDYMQRGTLADHLYNFDKNGNSSLSWVQRLKICIGAARGLDYLHNGTSVKHRVIHRDVKSSNILLDDNWIVKLSDFGISKIGPANQEYTLVSTNVKGTFGYVDPEYFLTHKLTAKSDVYSFGVVLFEVLCGRPALDLTLPENQRGLARWAQKCIEKGTLNQIIDPSLSCEIFPNSLIEFAQIANKCLNYRRKKRPTMTEVLARLQFVLALQKGTDSSIVDEEIFSISGTYERHHNVDSSGKQQEVISGGNGRHHDKQIDEIGFSMDHTSFISEWSDYVV